MKQPPQERYAKIGAALARQPLNPRTADGKIVFNLCEWGLNNPAEWAVQVGAESWRSSGDIKRGIWANYFQSMQFEIKVANVFADVAGPGRFNDPDELQIGNLPCNDSSARAQLYLWTIAKAPLVLSTPLGGRGSDT